jgi:RNA polymerase sigma-70 factor (ECF subfamily)
MRDQQAKAAFLAIPFDDAGLVEQSRQGDIGAFERLVVKYQDRVFNTCRRMCGNRSDAEDLAQETFVRAFKSLGTFAGRSKFSTWLFRIAVNLAISSRRNRRRATHSLDGDPARDNDGTASAARWPASPTTTPADEALEREQQRLTLQALADLDEESRSVVILRDLEEFGYDEIAEIMQVPVGTVKSRLHRARMALRERLPGVLGTV